MSKTDRVPYAKPTPSKKLMGRGGPRDMQRRQQSGGVLSTPKIESTDLDAIKKLLEEKLGGDVGGEPVGGIPIEEVERRVVEAVEATRKEEAQRYESGLKSLNEQLNAAKTKIHLMNEELEKREASSEDTKNLKSEIKALKNKIRFKDGEIKGKDKRIDELIDKIKSGGIPDDVQEQIEEYRKEIAKLKNQLRIASQSKEKLEDKDNKIDKLSKKVEQKDKELEEARKTIESLKSSKDKSNDDLVEMKATMELMFEKISNLQTASAVSEDGSPSIDAHKVFIDPTVDKSDLEPHIDVEASSTVGGDRDIRTDLDKLRRLVKGDKYKPQRAKSKLLDD